MTVEELIRELEGMDLEAEVRLAMQPNYPFEHTIDRVEEVGLIEDWCEDDYTVDGGWDPEEGYPVDRDIETVVYLTEGRQIGYLPEQARQHLECRQ